MPEAASSAPEWPHLDKAPIQEALLDIQLACSVEATAEAVEKLHESIRDDYPMKRKQGSWVASFEIGPAGVSAAKRDDGPVGFRFDSKDGRSVLQVTPRAFTFSRLRPYETWSNFRAEASRLWKLYSPVASPSRIERIGLRYINRIAVPQGSFDVKDYLLIQPDIPATLQREMSSYFMRLVIPAGDGMHVIVTEASEANGPDACVLVLDIDAIKPTPTPIEDLWAVVDRARAVKNDVFFKTITDRTRELCK